MKKGWRGLIGFFVKLSPVYMKNKQRNLDLRTKDDKPVTQHNFVKVKPGKSYFFAHIIVLLTLFLYYLFFYKNITGENSSNSIISLDLESFSINQVFIILALMMLMFFERVFHRQRFYLKKGSKSTPSFLIRNTMTFKILFHLACVVLIHI
mmetsp:Transcript_22704/g.17129  ORF Transcript_22704/g.17129 Transcript_22704/m.17129 type:complete len:151 (+) Transcript_22704:1060-1512(+)